MTTSLVFALQHHQSRYRDYLCHYGVGTDAASVKAEKLLWHLGDVLPPPKKKTYLAQYPKRLNDRLKQIKAEIVVEQVDRLA